MTSAAEDLVKKSLEMRENGRIDEAIITARRATTVDPSNANTWWQLGLALAEKDGAAASISSFKKTVEIADGFAHGWHRLGAAYKKVGMLDQAIESWEQAVEQDDDQIDSLTALSDAYRERDFGDDEEKLFEVLTLLDSKGKITPSDLNVLGIAYYKKKDHHKAIRCYRRYAQTNASPIGYFNLGLALSSAEVSQDADAVDAWRQALGRDLTYERAQNSLNAILPRLLHLRERVLVKNENLISQDQWFVNYINAFELLNLTNVDDPFDLDVKTIQRAKKALLQEIELADGLVEWVPGLQIDRSQAIKVSDQLTDQEDRYWHHLVYKNKPLLDFLSRGKVLHFLVAEQWSPLEILESIEGLPDAFEELIGGSFVAQFGLLLTKAVDKRDVDLIEALLDGRRWVSPEQEDKCFEGAIRQIGFLITPLRQAAEESEKVKPSVRSVQTLLSSGNMGKIIGMLPRSFQAIQNEAASLVRGISINANNHHDDPELAKQIMGLASTLAGRSPSFLAQIEEDTKILDEQIEGKKKAQEAEKIDQLLEPLRAAAENSERLKPSIQSIRAVLGLGNMSEVISALPSAFQRFQDEAASLMRSISIDVCNHHDDVDLAKEILSLGKSLLSRSSTIRALIDKDMKTLDERIKNESKDEAFLTYQGATYSITRKAVTFGDQGFPIADARTLRWGITVNRSGTATTHAFAFAVGSKGGNVLTLGWSASNDLEAQRALFNKFIEASFSYLVPRVIEMIRIDLDRHQTIRIGAALLSRSGITFTIEGWFSNKQELCPWHRLRSEIDNGEAVITDASNSKCKVSLPLATVDNAIVLHLMIKNHS